MQQSSQDLVRQLARVATGDRAAFGELYRATSSKLFGVILRILGRRDLAEDVLQEVYVRIWERAGDFDADRASPITWMATIARNRALDEIRRAGPGGKAPVSLDDAPDALEMRDTAMLASDSLERTDELKRLEACLDRLGPERKQLIKLAYLDGLSREELARRFGHPAATIKTWLHRGLKQVKDCLGT